MLIQSTILSLRWGSVRHICRVANLSECRHSRAFSLVELLFVVAILGLLGAFAYPAYQAYIDQTDVFQASQDITIISASVSLYKEDGGEFPDTLAQMGIDMTDPWGNPYRYLRIEGAKGKGAVRKDKNLVPINSDFDLYSAGKDGATTGPLTAKSSHDDIVRANNGGFIGLAIDY